MKTIRNIRNHPEIIYKLEVLSSYWSRSRRVVFYLNGHNFQRSWMKNDKWVETLASNQSALQSCCPKIRLPKKFWCDQWLYSQDMTLNTNKHKRLTGTDCCLLQKKSITAHFGINLEEWYILTIYCLMIIEGHMKQGRILIILSSSRKNVTFIKFILYVTPD